jgi:HK97 family phage prohead protease
MSETAIERRLLGFELRALANAAPRLVGYAAKFNVWSGDLGGFRERIQPGAFDKVLREGHDVRLLVNHEGVPLARSSKGTLRLSTDDVGLLVEAELPSHAGALVESMRRGDIDQMSFGFRVQPGGAAWDIDAEPVERTVTEIAELFDVSVVTYPAYPQTEVALRSLAQAHAARVAVAVASVLAGAVPAENIRLRRRLDGR